MVEETKHFDYLSLPGWDDIIHIIPPPTITEEEMEEHRRRSRKREPSNLSYKQLQLLQKKRERYLRMKRSPTPEFVKCISKIMTDYDDLEDGLITAAVMGRLVVKLLPRLMGRFVPAVGWCLLAADVINLFQIMSWLPFFGMSAKRCREGLTERNPLGRTARLKRAKRIRRVKPTFGEVLEVAQTTDQLFGVGVCLGGIVGYVIDCASAVFKGLTQPLPRPLYAEAARGFFATMKSTMTVSQLTEELTDNERSVVAISHYMHHRRFAGWFDDFDWYFAAEDFVNRPIRAHASMSPSTQYILEDAGEDIEETMRWPMKGTPKETTLAEFTEQAFPLINAAILDYCMRMKNTYEGYIASHCWHEFLYDHLLLWEGHNPYSSEFYQRDQKETYITLYSLLGGKSKSNPTFDYSKTEKDGINKGILEKGETDVERISSIMLEHGILPQPKETLENLELFFNKVIRGDQMAHAKSGPQDIYNTYYQTLGPPRRHFPIFPKNASFEFITNQEQFSESFKKHMMDRGGVLWPNWELFPKEAVELYLAEGLL